MYSNINIKVFFFFALHCSSTCHQPNKQLENIMRTGECYWISAVSTKESV